MKQFNFLFLITHKHEDCLYLVVKLTNKQEFPQCYKVSNGFQFNLNYSDSFRQCPQFLKMAKIKGFLCMEVFCRGSHPRFGGYFYFYLKGNT